MKDTHAHVTESEQCQTLKSYCKELPLRDSEGVKVVGREEDEWGINVPKSRPPRTNVIRVAKAGVNVTKEP